jgi:hypothetical protein
VSEWIQPSRAELSCPDLASVALSLDPGLDPVGAYVLETLEQELPIG